MIDWAKQKKIIQESNLPKYTDGQITMFEGRSCYLGPDPWIDWKVRRNGEEIVLRIDIDSYDRGFREFYKKNSGIEVMLNRTEEKEINRFFCDLYEFLEERNKVWEAFDCALARVLDFEERYPLFDQLQTNGSWVYKKEG